MVKNNGVHRSLAYQGHRMEGPTKMNAGVRYNRKGRWTQKEVACLKRTQQENPNATMGELALAVWSRNAKQVRDRLNGSAKAKSSPVKRFSGYKRVEKAYGWKQIRREGKSSTYNSNGKITGVNTDGTYQITLSDGDVQDNVSADSIRKLSGTRRSNQEEAITTGFRLGDGVSCKLVQQAGRMQICWYNPRSGEAMWNCPPPADRVFTAYESVGERATHVKPIEQRCSIKTTENVPSQFKR